MVAPRQINGSDIATVVGLASGQTAATLQGALADFSGSAIYVPSYLALTKQRTALAKVKAGVRRQRIAILGDSTNVGRGAGTGSVGEIGARVLNPISWAANYLNAANIPARADAVFGHSNVQGGNTAALNAYNPSIAFSADWGLLATNCLGGSYFSNSTGTGSITYTPDRAADRFDILYAINAGGGTFTVTDASGTLATINSNPSSGPNTVGKATVTRSTASVSPISIQRTTGGGVYIGGIDPWNSTLPEICFLSTAIVGAVATIFTDTTQTYSAKTQLNVLAPDLSYIEFGLNEKNNGVALSQYVNNLQALITQQVANSNAVCVAISAPGTAGSGFDLTSDWRSAIASAGLLSGSIVINHHEYFVSREIDTSIYFDSAHLTKSGYAKKGKLLADFALR